MVLVRCARSRRRIQAALPIRRRKPAGLRPAGFLIYQTALGKSVVIPLEAGPKWNGADWSFPVLAQCALEDSPRLGYWHVSACQWVGKLRALRGSTRLPAVLILRLSANA